MRSILRSSTSWTATGYCSLSLGICLLLVGASCLLGQGDPPGAGTSQPSIPVVTAPVAASSPRAGNSALAGRSGARHTTHLNRMAGTAECSCNRDCGGSSCTQCCPSEVKFKIHPAKGTDVTVKINDKTKITPKGKTADDIKANARVTVTYRNDSTDNWAVTVHFFPEKKAIAPKTTGRR
jgi:hypothetical protein